MTLKTHGIMGPMKHVQDPVVIPEEEDTVGGSAKRNKTWDEIQKSMSQ